MVHSSISGARLRSNVTRLQALSFTWMFMLMMPVIVPYFGLSGLGIDRVFQLQAIFAITVVLLEVPSGYVSDLLGRRGCLILAGLLHGVAYSLLAWASSFWGFVLFELAAAVGVCFYSGTDVALLYDSLEALGDPSGKRRLLGRRLMWMQGGETAAALLAALLISAAGSGLTLQELAYANAVVGWAPFFLALSLVDVVPPGLSKTSHLRNASMIWRGVMNESRALRLVLFNLIIYGLSTLIAVWAFQDYWTHLDVPLAYFGLLWAAYNLAVALVGRLAHRVEDRIGFAMTVKTVGLLPVLGYGGMALCSLQFATERAVQWAVLGVCLGLLFQIGRGLTQVVIKDSLNTSVPAAWRATANSIASLGVRLSFFVLGPILGWLAANHGYPMALGAFGALYVVLFLTLNRALRDIQAPGKPV